MKPARLFLILILFVTVLCAIVIVSYSHLEKIIYKGDVTEKPAISYQLPVFEPQESIIGFSLSVPLSALKDKLNKALPKIIPIPEGEKAGCLKKKVLGLDVSVGCKWWGQIERRSEITVSEKEDSIELSLPIHTTVSFQTTGIQLQETIEADLTLFARIRPELKADWTLNPNFELDFTWDSRPTMLIFNIIPISVTNLVEPALKDQISGLKQKVENEVFNLDFQSNALKAWNTLFLPIKLSDSPVVWMRMNPHALRFSGLKTQNDLLKAGFSFIADLESTVGAKPEPYPKKPLPDIKSAKPDQKAFAITLPIKIDYNVLIHKAEKLLRQGEKWSPFKENPGLQVTVHHIEIYPHEGSIVLGIQFIADLPYRPLDTEGTVFLIGTPIIDNHTKTFRIDNIRFTRFTDNRLTDIISLVFQEEIIDRLERSLTFSFEESYTSLISESNQKLNHDFGNGIRSMGQVNSLKIDNIQMLKEGILIELLAEGDLSFTIAEVAP